MIASSVDTTDFSQIVPDERFNVDAPHTNSLLASSSLDVTRMEEGLQFSVFEKPDNTEVLSVENTLRDIAARCEVELEKSPESIPLKLNLALALINRGDPDRGSRLLLDVLEKQPSNYIALTSFALLLFNRGDLDGSKKAYLRLHLSYPKDPSPLINLASVALRSEDYFKAEEYLEKAVALDGCSVMAKYLLAMVLLRLGKNNGAISLLRAALRESGPSAELNQGLAIAYLISGDHRRAERAFLTALTINNRLDSAVHGLATLRIQQRRFDDVIGLLLDHLSRVPNDLQARELLASAYVQNGQFARARGQLSQLVPSKGGARREQTELARISNNIGFCFAHEGKVTDAEPWLRRSIDLDGTNSVSPYTNLARMFVSRGRYQDALKVLDQLDSSRPSSSDASLLRAVALVSLDRVDEAISVLQALIETGTAPASAYADLGGLLADRKEQYDAAISILRIGVERHSSNPGLLNNLAYCYLMRGEPEFARPILEGIKDWDSNIVMFTATKGLLLLWEGDIEGGEELYRDAEALAFQRGMRDLAISIRQKKHLELTRAYLRSDRKQEAYKQLQMGLRAAGGQQYYRFSDHLSELRRLLLESSDAHLLAREEDSK